MDYDLTPQVQHNLKVAVTYAVTGLSLGVLAYLANYKYAQATVVNATVGLMEAISELPTE